MTIQPIVITIEEMDAIREENARLISEGHAPYPTANLRARPEHGAVYVRDGNTLFRTVNGAGERSWDIADAPAWVITEANALGVSTL